MTNPKPLEVLLLLPCAALAAEQLPLHSLHGGSSTAAVHGSHTGLQASHTGRLVHVQCRCLPQQRRHQQQQRLQ
jgi:hypothetical protein